MTHGHIKAPELDSASITQIPNQPKVHSTVPRAIRIASIITLAMLVLAGYLLTQQGILAWIEVIAIGLVGCLGIWPILRFIIDTTVNLDMEKGLSLFQRITSIKQEETSWSSAHNKWWKTEPTYRRLLKCYGQFIGMRFNHDVGHALKALGKILATSLNEGKLSEDLDKAADTSEHLLQLYAMLDNHKQNYRVLHREANSKELYEEGLRVHIALIEDISSNLLRLAERLENNYNTRQHYLVADQTQRTVAELKLQLDPLRSFDNQLEASQ